MRLVAAGCSVLLLLLAGAACRTGDDTEPGPDGATPTATAAVGPASRAVTVGAPQFSSKALGLTKVHDLAVGADLVAAYAATPTSTFVGAWDRATGAERWRVGGGSPLPPGVQELAGDDLQVGSSGDDAVAVLYRPDTRPHRQGVAGLARRDGSLRWTWQPRRIAGSSREPSIRMVGVVGGVLVVSYGDLASAADGLGCARPMPRRPGTAIVGLDLAGGAELWRRDDDCADRVLDGRIVTAPVRGEDFGGQAVVDPATGEEVWRAPGDQDVRGLSGDVALTVSGYGGRLVDLTDPEASDLPAVPDRFNQRGDLRLDGLIVLRGEQGVLTYRAGETGLSRAPGLEIDARVDGSARAGRVVVEDGAAIRIYGRDGALLCPPVRGRLHQVGDDYLDVGVHGDRQVLPLAAAAS